MPSLFRLSPFTRALLALRPINAGPTLALALMLPLAAQVQAQEFEFNIPAQPLDAALQDFNKQANLQLLYNPAEINGLRNNAIKGRLSMRAAIENLLRDTGAGYRLEGEILTITVIQSGTTTLKTVKVVDQADLLDSSNSYTVPSVSIGKGQQKLKDIPQSISVLTRERLDNQNIESLPDIVNNVTGLTFSKSPGPGGYISSRGFDIGTLQYDGVPMTRNTYSLGSYLTEATKFYDRVEILRGAAGLLQGANSPGGAINFVRKRGSAAPQVTLTGKAGSWDRYGAEVDAGSPLNNEGTLRGRAVASYEKGDSYIDYAWNWEQNLYLALDYDIADTTTLGLGASSRKTHFRPYFIGLPRYSDTTDIDLPRSTFTGSDWNRGLTEQNTVNFDIEHSFNENWQLKTSLMTMEESNEATYQYMVAPVGIAANGSGARYFEYSTDFRSKFSGADIYLSGNFQAWGVKHETIIGANYTKYTTDDAYAAVRTPGANIFDIDRHRPWLDFDSISAAGQVTSSQYDIRQKGIYGTWRVHVTEPLSLILGVRTSWFDSKYNAQYAYENEPDPSSDYEESLKSTGHVTPYVGVVYALTPEWSTYASYSDVFIPQIERTVSGSTLDPIEGTNLELGVKGELANGRVNTSAAIFRYDHENRAVADIDAGEVCDGSYCSIASGKVRSQGFETEISGEISAQFQVSAGYTYNTTKYLDDIDHEGGIFSTWTPKHMLKLWADYTLPGVLNSFSLGGGVNAQSHTLSYDRRFELPGLAIWNARIGYRLNDTVAFAVNVNNVFDKKYYIPSYNAVSANNYYGDPRNVMFTVKYTPKL